MTDDWVLRQVWSELEEANRLKRIELNRQEEREKKREETERMERFAEHFRNYRPPTREEIETERRRAEAWERSRPCYLVKKKNFEVVKVSTEKEAEELYQEGEYTAWTKDFYQIDQLRESVWDEKYKNASTLGKIGMLFCGHPRSYE